MGTDEKQVEKKIPKTIQELDCKRSLEWIIFRLPEVINKKYAQQNSKMY